MSRSTPDSPDEGNDSGYQRSRESWMDRIERKLDGIARESTASIGKIEGLEDAIKEIKDLYPKTFVTRWEFLPTKLIAYGLVSTAMVALLLTLLRLVHVGDLSGG